MKKRLLIIATLDTKGREAAYVKGCAHKLGIHPILMDIGTLGEPLTHPDIPLSCPFMKKECLSLPFHTETISSAGEP